MKSIILFTIALSLNLMIGCSSNEESQSNDSDNSVVNKITMKRASGTVSLDNAYEDEISIVDNVMTIKRTGGSKVIAGVWTVSLTNDEIGKINEKLSKITVADADTIISPAPVGGGKGNLSIGIDLSFKYGLYLDGVTNNYYAYSDDVQNLNDYINSIISSSGHEVAYSASA